MKIIIPFLLLFLFIPSAHARVTPSGLLQCTNEIRAEYGLKPLIIDHRLSKAARNKVGDMIEFQYWSHQDHNGDFVWHLIDEAGYSYASAAENLARNFRDSKAVCRAWKASKSHLENIISPSYMDVGFAVRRNIVVQILGSK